MNAIETWHTQNADYLSAALDWLRLRLEQQSQRTRSQSQAAQPVQETPAAEPSLRGLFRRTSSTESSADAINASRLPPPPTAAAGADKMEPTTARMAAAAARDPAPALVLLAQRLGLSNFERDVLLLCVAMELDTRMSGFCSRAQDDAARPWPTFALAMTLFDEPAWEALSPERPLRYWRLLEINQPGAQPLTLSALRADERIVSFVKGLNYLDDRLAPLVMPVPLAEAAPAPASQRAAVEAIVAAVATLRASPGLPPVVRLLGSDRASKRVVASAASAALDLHLYRLPAEVLPTHPGELETLARLWQRESLLLPLALYLDASGVEKGSGSDNALQQVSRFVLRTGGLVFLDARDGVAASLDGALSVEVRKPTPAEQRAAWHVALGEAAGETPALLAGQFNLNLADIHDIAARAHVGQPDAGLRERLWQECRASTRPGLDSLAENLAPKATWDDIVLPKSEDTLLRQIAGQVAARAQVYDEWGFRARMNRGLGISALFAGDSGTGKTMAAEVLANDLELDLLRIDLSAVVSKYIGETEKNLRQVFDGAEDGGAILFFDEADALFGKRSEVKDSHDRYANIEINYLLQRMEAYRGLAILATNMKSALDPAFVRRLRFIVNFPYPGPAERRLIWQRALPPDTPRGALDYDRLAKLNLTGGNIHSIALNAAFLAARAGTPVTMPLVLEAARNELRKLDRPVNEADLRWVQPAGAAA